MLLVIKFLLGDLPDIPDVTSSYLALNASGLLVEVGWFTGGLGSPLTLRGSRLRALARVSSTHP